jgi:hypothetical protein
MGDFLQADFESGITLWMARQNEARRRTPPWYKPSNGRLMVEIGSGSKAHFIIGSG